MPNWQVSLLVLKNNSLQSLIVADLKTGLWACFLLPLFYY